MLVLRKDKFQSYTESDTASKDKALGTPSSKMFGYNFPKSSDIQNREFSPTSSGSVFHAFCIFGFKDMIKQVSNENIPFSWKAFSILFRRSIINL